MTIYSVLSTSKDLVRGRTALIGLSLAALIIVGCSSTDDPTATPSSPDPTEIPAATQVPNPTATTAPSTGDETPVPPTEVPVATEVPKVDPTAIPATVAPTATPDPFVILNNILSDDVEPNRFPIVAPGNSELLERLFPEAPPYAPHTVDDTRITVDQNQCVTCHVDGSSFGGNIATEIPLSHYTDALTGAVSAELDPRRYICTTCHVPQVTDPVPWAE
jgi:nitrate reductase cytochrome c-type subunit